VDKLTGVVSLALGEPVARRNYYRSAWIEFGTEKEARDAMEQLSGQDVSMDGVVEHCMTFVIQVDNFKLQVTMIRSPLIAKIKRTSVLVSADTRLAKDLDIMRKLVNLLEKETDMLVNYKPLVERQTTEDKEGDIKMESPVKENGSDRTEHIHRGTKAVEAYLDKRLPAEDTDASRSQRVCICLTQDVQNLCLSIHRLVFLWLDHDSCPCPWTCICNIFVPDSTAAIIAL
jgi:hypothetical protein